MNKPPYIPTLVKPNSEDSKCDCATEYEIQDEKVKTPEIQKRDKHATKSTGVHKRNKKEVKKTSHSAQTDVDEQQRRDSGPLSFRTMFSNISEGVGPWIPYIGGSAVILMLLGFLTNNVDMLLGMFEFEFDEKSSTPGSAASEPESPWPAPTAPETPPPEGSCKAKCAFRVNRHKIKWPDM